MLGEGPDSGLEALARPIGEGQLLCFPDGEGAGRCLRCFRTSEGLVLTCFRAVFPNIEGTCVGMLSVEPLI